MQLITAPTVGDTIGNLTPDPRSAATALVHGLPMVTRNAAEFERLHSLQVVSYGDPDPPGTRSFSFAS